MLPISQTCLGLGSFRENSIEDNIRCSSLFTLFFLLDNRENFKGVGQENRLPLFLI